jgi:hypothetical protein
MRCLYHNCRALFPQERFTYATSSDVDKPIVCEFTDLALMLLFEYGMLHKVQARYSMGLLDALFVAVYTSLEIQS